MLFWFIEIVQHAQACEEVPGSNPPYCHHVPISTLLSDVKKIANCSASNQLGVDFVFYISFDLSYSNSPTVTRELMAS